MAVDLYSIVEYAEVKQYLRLTNDDDQELIEALVESAQQAIEDFCHTFFIVRERTEHHAGGILPHRGGSRVITLNRAPVPRVFSIEDDDGHTVEADDYTLLSEQGQLLHTSRWPIPTGLWHISFDAGLWDTAYEVRRNAKLAVQIETAERYHNQTGSTIVQQKIGDLYTAYGNANGQPDKNSAIGLAPIVERLIQPFIRDHGV